MVLQPPRGLQKHGFGAFDRIEQLSSQSELGWVSEDFIWARLFQKAVTVVLQHIICERKWRSDTLIQEKHGAAKVVVPPAHLHKHLQGCSHPIRDLEWPAILVVNMTIMLQRDGRVLGIVMIVAVTLFQSLEIGANALLKCYWPLDRGLFNPYTGNSVGAS